MILSVNFNCDKIIIIHFIGGASGHLLSRLLSISKEVASRNTRRAKLYTFTSDKRFRYYVAHRWYSWFYGDWPFDTLSNNNEIIDFIKNKTTDNFKKLTQENRIYIPLLTHSIKTSTHIFPKAKHIFINLKNKKSRYFAIRATYEKHYCNPYIITKNKEEGFNQRKQLYNMYYCYWFDKNKIYDQEFDKDYFTSDNFFVLPLDKILDSHQSTYEEMCKFLNITPSTKFKKLIRKYNSGQWIRPPKKS